MIAEMVGRPSKGAGLNYGLGSGSDELPGFIVMTSRNRRPQGFDAAAIVEVIEHLDPPRPAAFERVVFGPSPLDSIVIRIRPCLTAFTITRSSSSRPARRSWRWSR